MWDNALFNEKKVSDVIHAKKFVSEKNGLLCKALTYDLGIMVNLFKKEIYFLQSRYLKNYLKVKQFFERMIKAIIFDLGGVCFEVDWLKINEEMVKKFNISTLVKSAGNEMAIKYYKDSLEGRGHIKNMFQELNKSSHKLEDVVRFYKKIYKKYKKHNKKIYALIKKLKKKFIVACLTDTNSVHFEAHREQGTIKDFHKVFASFQIGHIKKDINSFKKIIKELELEPKEILFIDDNDKNIETAKLLGIKAIKYRNYGDLIKELKILKVV